MLETATEPGLAETEFYRRLLLEKKAEVVGGLVRSFDALFAAGPVAEDDPALLLHDEFVSLLLSTLDYEQMRLIDDALLRLDSGDYGLCERCQRQIAANRLNAVPWAKFCLDCQ